MGYVAKRAVIALIIGGVVFSIAKFVYEVPPVDAFPAAFLAWIGAYYFLTRDLFAREGM